MWHGYNIKPVTRSRTHSSDSGTDAQPPHGPTAVVKMTARLPRTLTDLADTDPVHGKDAKPLRDAAAQAIHEPRGRPQFRRPEQPRSQPTTCFNCEGQGHISRQCSSPSATIQGNTGTPPSFPFHNRSPRFHGSTRAPRNN
ncbi:zinc knuckle [Ancylostoma caninum]|uniref:Zinc knuckle n=1 Tax=Ancylostoma caninum TaxID=29170 RepID=A0A368F6S4_ANCCA|nr:zinc knuckle [Ancylostoma caninum]